MNTRNLRGGITSSGYKFGMESQKDHMVLLSKYKRYKKEIGGDENKIELDKYLDEVDSAEFDVLK